jgi:predicted Zn-dependent protease
MINSVGLFAILSAFLGDISSLAGAFANLGGNLATLSNSRSFENEADNEGWRMLQKAKINPKGMISFFETLKADHTTKMDTLINNTIDLSFLSTHPNTQQRIDNLKMKGKNDPNKYLVLPNNYNKFKDAFSNL